MLGSGEGQEKVRQGKVKSQEFFELDIGGRETWSIYKEDLTHALYVFFVEHIIMFYSFDVCFHEKFSW